MNGQEPWNLRQDLSPEQRERAEKIGNHADRALRPNLSTEGPELQGLDRILRRRPFDRRSEPSRRLRHLPGL
jgi:hypothetical protein